ncbi:MFS transporter [Paraburkholderia sp. LEh10]|uniref:MFS transporter n=1 Tax=Paraburkholderia sp. LEh10 TaxID=2821353 RepID=UPI001AEAC8D5|nr:MFS transporter [Paraburkholderia sp. LEh10]
MANIDRVNLGIAQLQMETELGFTDAIYGMGAGIFFLAYSLFELPSSFLMMRLGALRMMTLLTIGWGCASAATMFVHDPASLYALRFLLGMFEAGFFPTVVFYLTRWYPQQRRTKPLALFASGIVVSNVLAYPLSGWIVKYMHGFARLSGWQWIFPLEGLPCVALGLLIPLLLDESPKSADWLDDREKSMIAASFEHDALAAEGQTFRQMLGNPRLYGLMAVYFSIVAAIAVLAFWLPKLIRSLGVTDIGTIGLYAAVPNAVALIAMIAIGARTDRRRRWSQNTITAAFIGAVSLCLLPLASSSFVLSLELLSIAAVALYSLIPLFWAIVPACLPGPGTPNAIAAVTTLGVLGAVVSPLSIGWLNTHTGSLTIGLYAFGALLASGALLLAFVIRRVTALQR